MSSRFASIFIFSLGMLALFGGSSLHADNPPFQIWTPASNRPIMTVDLMYAKNALQTLQDTLKGFRNGLQSRTYVTGYLPNHMSDNYLMKNAQLFVEPSRWQSARQKINELDSLLMLNKTNNIQPVVDSITRILEDGKADIEQRLTAIAVNSKMSRRGRAAGVAIQSPVHLNQLHRDYQHQKTQQQERKNVRQEALKGEQEQQSVPQQQTPEDEDTRIRQELVKAGLSADKIDELFKLLQELHESKSQEAQNKLIEFIKNLPEAQREAIFKLMGPLGEQIKEAIKQSSNGFIDMIKAHPYMTGGLALVAGAAIMWALLRSDDPGTVFGGKIKGVFNWIKSFFGGSTDNNQNPQPQPVPNPAPQQQQPQQGQQQQNQQPNPNPAPQPVPEQAPQANPDLQQNVNAVPQHANGMPQENQAQQNPVQQPQSNEQVQNPQPIVPNPIPQQDQPQQQNNQQAINNEQPVPVPAPNPVIQPNVQQNQNIAAQPQLVVQQPAPVQQAQPNQPQPVVKQNEVPQQPGFMYRLAGTMMSGFNQGVNGLKEGLKTVASTWNDMPKSIV